MDFYSPFQFRHPNVGAYEAQKRLHIISAPSQKLCAAGLSMPGMLLGNGERKKLWNAYYGPRLFAAAFGARLPYSARFPGHTVAGPGAGTHTQYAGSLAIERFEHVLCLAGGLPAIGPFSKQYAVPYTFAEMPHAQWPWGRIARPKLKMVMPAATRHSASAHETQALCAWLARMVASLVHKENIPVRKLFALIQSAWSPCTMPRVCAPETIAAAQCLIDEMKFFIRATPCHWLAFVFELEACLSAIEYSWPLNVASYGTYEGRWVEIGRLPISAIRITELAVVQRVLAECATIRANGFAPIVVNEYGCDTDGTHRLVASWLWNMLKALGPHATDADIGALTPAVASFVARHEREMGPVVIHEVLRSYAEIMADATMRTTLVRDVVPHVAHYHPVTHLPVVLLPEYSCGAVIKALYDEEGAHVRVDPSIYEHLARHSDCVLPARGPYHLTDRALLPWFAVLEPH